MSEFKDDDLISDELKKSIENANKLAQSIEPILSTQRELAAITRPLGEMAAINSAISAMKFSSPALDALKGMPRIVDCLPKYQIAQNLIEPLGLAAIRMSAFHIDTSAFQMANTIQSVIPPSLTSSVQSVIANYSSALTAAIRSPFVEWLREIDFTPLTRIWENWDFDPTLAGRYDELNEIYLQAMYDAKWFPYAGWIADIELFAEVNDILASSRGMSKRCEKRIDKAITSYYTKAEIKRIKKQWQESDLEPHMKKALGQTLEAYLRKEYALVIPFLATMWEGIIKSKTAENKKRTNDEKKADFKNLVDENGYDEVFSDFYNNLIVGTCYSVEDVVEGVPNRNGVAHSWYPKYPNQKAALNAILLTDFLINLKPKKAPEQNTTPNGEQEDKVNG